MKHYFYPLAFSALLLGGCSKTKEDAPLVLAGEYQAAHVLAATNPIRMYTRTGEITNVQTIDNFLRRQSSSGQGLFSRTDVTITTPDSQTLTIDANDQATVATTYQGTTTRLTSRITLRNPQYFVLTSTDSVSTVTAPSSFDRCVQLVDQIRAIAPVKRCQALPPITGYSQSCTFHPVQVVGIQNGQLFLPAFSWLIMRSVPSLGWCTYTAANERNLFNPAILNQLVAGDTVVVQERRIALTKQ
ncbi:hypothetical protein GCM10028822_29230 [Hymenobacter terrigena]